MKTLGSLAEAIVDCEHRTAPAGDGYALSVGTRAMKDGRLVAEACKPVSRETYEAWTRRMRPRPGDLILAREAPVGQVVRVPAGRRVCLGQRTVMIRPSVDAVHPRFLHYWLLGPDAQHAMASRAAGSTVPHLNVADIRDLDVSPMPTSRRAQAIAGELLGALDDLVENNRQRVEVLEEMARAIYREWFVNFRYPGYGNAAFVDSPLGRIPEGWDVSKVADIASDERYAVTGGPFGSKLGRKDYRTAGVPVLRGANLRVGGGFDESSLVFVSDAKAAELSSSLARPGDLIVTQRGTLGQVGWIPESSRFDRYVLSQSQMKVRTHPSKMTMGFLYAQMRSPETTQRFVGQAMTAGVPHVNLTLLREFEVLVPPLELQDRFSKATDDLVLSAQILASESESLCVVRDLLLPKLVTGQIDVSALDLDAAAEDSVA